MSRRVSALVAVLVLLHVGAASAQHPILDMAANKLIQKYQNSTCEQLWQQKAHPKSAEDQEFIQFLRSDPQLRIEFINRVAAPIANKMFDCGMIP